LTILSIVYLARLGLASSLPENCDLKAFLSVLSENFKNVRQEISDHAVSSPADTRLLGRLDRLEEQLAKLTGIIEASTMGDQTAPENSIDSLSLKTTIQELLQKNQECEEQLTQCEAKMNQVDEVKSTVQEIKQNLDDLKTKQNKLEQKTTDVATKAQLEIKRRMDQQASNAHSMDLIAFSCYRSSPFHPSSTTPMTYNGCQLDTTSGSISIGTGKFTAPRAGIYRFHFHGLVDDDSYGWASMMKGSTRITKFARSRAAPYGTIGGSMSTKMEAGEEVYVRIDGGSDIYSNSDKYTLFEGFLLAPL